VYIVAFKPIFLIMADGRESNGGVRENSGRGTRLEITKLIKHLGKYEKAAHDALEKLVKAGNIHAIKLYFEYGYGKATQPVEGKIEHTGVITWNETKTYDGKADGDK